MFEDQQNYSRQLENYKSTLDTMEDNIESEKGNVQTDMAMEYFTYINKMRHDLFLTMIQMGLNLEIDAGDKNPKDQLLNELQNKGNERDYYHYRDKFEQQPFKNFNKTPDIVNYSYTADVPEEMVIIDVAVSRNPAMAVTTKFDKYRIMLEMFSELSPKLGVIYYNTNDHTVGYKFMPENYNLELGDLPIDKYASVVEKGEALKFTIKKKLTDKDLEEFNSWMKDSKTDEDLGASPFKDFEFAVSLREFQAGLENDKPLRRFLTRELNENHKELLIRSLHYNCSKETDHIKIENFTNMIESQTDDMDKGNDEYFQKMGDKIYEQSTNFKSEKLPEEPSEEEITHAFNDLHQKASNVFSKQRKPKLLNPIHLNFSKYSDFAKKEKGWIIKKRRMENVYNLLDEAKTDKSLVRALQLIFKPSQVSDKQYEEQFIKGELYILENGGVVKKEDFLDKIKERNKDYRRLIARDETKVGEFDHIENEKEIIAVSYKKGEVISIKPQNLREVKDLLHTAGVGVKKPLEERDHVEKFKVKSLPFWDEYDLKDICDEFDKIVDEMEMSLTRIGGSLKDKEFQEFESGSNEGATSSESDDSNESEESEINSNFERGMKYFMRHHEILWENLSFVAHMGGNGFRIVQGITDNSFLIVLPTESIMKGDTGVPFINVSVVDNRSEHFSFNDKYERVIDCGEKKIVVSGGRRIDRARLTGYLRVKPTFYSALAILNNYRVESKQVKLTRREQTRLALIIHNININTSSLIDNIRYMAENTMADYSFCGEFIKEKFMVPVKNHVQAYLYKRSKEMLISLRKEMQEVRVKKAVVNSEGEVNLDTARVISGSFTSFLESTVKYKKPEYLISEIYTLFFSVPKGLHGNYHVLLDIHKTPIEIQNNINKIYGKNVPISNGTPKTRFEFNPEVICLASMESDKNLANSYRGIRELFDTRERPNETPLRTRTTCSTRSTLVKDTGAVGVTDRGMIDMESSPLLSELSNEDFHKLQIKLSDFEMKNRKNKQNVVKKNLRGMRNNLDEECKGISNPKAKLQFDDFIKNKISYNFDTNCFEYKVNMAKNNYKWKLQNEMMNRHGKSVDFYTSGVVLTEVLKDVLQEENTGDMSKVDNLENISRKSKKAVLQKEKWIFAIRKKGQRTQKDREIFVVDLPCKYGLYIVEHFYKQMCVHLDEEKISEPGDMKIISLERQVRESFRWIARELEIEKKAEGDTVKGEGFHFNLDMTKWAPKDNVYKFIFMVACSRVMTFEEKLYCILCFGKLGDKRLYLDEELHYRLMINSDKVYIDKTGAEEVEDPFKKMSKDFSTNKIKIKETWLQGQLNYCSSWVHAGAVLLWRKYIARTYPGMKMRTTMNVHSDDQQSDVYVIMPKDMNEKDFIHKIWSEMDFIMKNCCIEISTKKSNISKMIKQFVSQYNIACEQIYLWCKPLMASISGCPYTTLKDDMSSLMSKVSEALSKGAPKNVARVVIDEMKLHLWNVYGIRTKKMENKFSHLIGIPEEMLPSCLGNSHIADYSTLAIAGPKTQDQMIIATLLSHCGATTDTEARSIPKNKNVQKALLLFYIMDLLTNETINEEEDISATVSLNPFKPTRFKAKRTGITDPFRDSYRGDRIETVTAIKKDSPGLGLVKPRTPNDLMKYYMVIYSNSNFRASLAGQSPNILHLNKIVNRKRGVFRIKESGNMSLEKFRDTMEKDQFTAEEISDFLLSCMKKIVLDLRMVNYLRTKFIVSDPEFRILQFTNTNANTTSAVVKKNPIPKKKPSPAEYSSIVNKVPLLLCYFFDEDYFMRNDFRIQYPSTIPNDLIHLNEMFPTEFGWLREQKRQVELHNFKTTDDNKKLRDKWINYETEVGRLEAIESEKIKLNRFINLQDQYIKSESQMVELLMNQEEILSKGGMASTLEHTTTLGDSKTSKEFDIFSRLVNNSKVIDLRTQKVIFCAPTPSNELHEIALATKTIIESTGDISVGFYLTVNQKQELRGLRINMIRAEKSEAVEFIKQLANLLKLMEKLKMSSEQMHSVTKSARINNTNMGTVEKFYKDLPRTYKRAALYPLCLMNPKNAAYYVSKLEPVTIKWIKPQSLNDLTFIVRVHYENIIISAQGSNKVIDTMTIEYSNELITYFLNRAFKILCADLAFQNRERFMEINLNEHLNLRPVETNWHQKNAFGYSSIKNEIVKGDDKMCTHLIRGIHLKMSKLPKTDKRIREAYVDPEFCSVIFKTMEEQEDIISIQMRTFKDTTITELEFDDIDYEGFTLSTLAKKRLYKALMTDRLYDVATNDAIKYYKYPGEVCASIGTFGAHYCYSLFTGSETGSVMYDRIKKSVDEINNSKNQSWFSTPRKPKKKTSRRLKYDVGSDDDETIDEIILDKQDKQDFYDSMEAEDLVDLLNKINGSYMEARKILDYKENDWDSLMKYVNDYDLRSVSKAITYMMTEDIKETGKDTDTTNYGKQASELNFVGQSTSIDRIKNIKVEEKLIVRLIKESQLYVFGAMDVTIFVSIGLCLHQAQKERKRYAYFTSMVRRMNSGRNVKQTFLTSLAICSSLLGDSLVDKIDNENNSSIKIDTMMLQVRNHFKMNKRHLSEYTIIVVDNMLKIWEKYQNEMVSKKEINIMETIVKKRRGKKGRAKEEEEKTKKPKKHEVKQQDDTLTTSNPFRKAGRLDPSSYQNSRTDIDAAEAIARLSKEFGESTEIGTTSMSEGELSGSVRQLKRKSPPRTLMEFAEEASRVLPTIKISEADIMAALEGGMGDGEEEDEMVFDLDDY